MNAGQIIMSMMQGVSMTAPNAAVTPGGTQMPGEGGFSDLLVALQTEAQLSQQLPETESELLESESEPVRLQSEGGANLARNCLEVSNAGAQMVLAAYAQPAGMPVVTSPPNQKVDAVQNVQPAPPLQQTVQTSVTAAVTAQSPTFEPLHVQSAPPAPAVSEQQTARSVPSVPVEMASQTVEAAVQRQPATSAPQPQDGRMPLVNAPSGQDVDAVQNVQPAPPLQQTVQTSVTIAVTAESPEPAHVQSAPPAPAVSEQQTARSVLSVPVEMASQTVEAAVQRQPAPSVPQPQPQNVTPTSAPMQTLEEIAFSLARPISISTNHPPGINRTQQSAFVDRLQIVSLDLGQNQNRSTDVQPVLGLPESIASVRHQEAGKAAPATNVASTEAVAARKEQLLAGISVMPNEAVVLKPEMDVSEMETADNHTASLQRSFHKPAVPIAVGTRIEFERQNDITGLTKEDLLVQQSAKPVGETTLTSDDSMGGSADQTGTSQNPDNRMLAHQLHGQSRTEHHKVAALSSDTSKPEPSGQELPERVAHQVRDRLNQHEVKQGSQQITLTLSPENLGELKMSLNLQGQRLSVEILTENRLVRDAILQHSDSLKESLARQNIAVESFDVTANGRGSGNPGHNQDAWKELARQKQQQHFWGSNGMYHPAPLESQSDPLAYRAGNEQAMLDIHY